MHFSVLVPDTEQFYNYRQFYQLYDFKYKNIKNIMLCCVIMSILVTSYILYSKYSSDVVNPLISSVLLRHVESSGDQVFLVILNLNHFPLDRLVGDELVDEDRLGLAQPVDPVEALPLAGRVPGGIQQEKVVGSGEIKSDTSGLKPAELDKESVMI